MEPTPIRPQEASAGHPIAVVAERTGLSRDVLRVWERRYAAVAPGRTPGGQRLYSDEQVERFRLLAAATRHGRSIKTVAGLSTAELERLVANDEAHRVAAPAPFGDSAYAECAESAFAHTRALDGTSLDRELRRAIARHGIGAFLEHIVPRLMHRIGEEWRGGRLTIAHEHLASAAALAIIFEAMRSVPTAPGAPRLLVTTPSGERHAVGAALSAAAAALDGWSIVYLGVDVPAADIVAAASASRADAVALSVVHSDEPAAVVRELHQVRAAMRANVTLLVGGAAAVRMAERLSRPGLIICASIAEMRGVLAHITESK
ncbi:MAG: cobalamin B12-binding domain-containing protein [Proteobacteria bacterium]|nr:cobalamin B12-binding domain-containing protein [Pseudomonadota bacterium]